MNLIGKHRISTIFYLNKYCIKVKRDKIYYLGTYDTPLSDVKRRFTVSAVSKMDYIISALNQSGYDVELISTSYILEKKWLIKGGERKRLNDYTVLVLSRSFGGKATFVRHFAQLFSIICFFLKLLKLTKRDSLIVYHAPWFSIPVRLAKYLKGFQLILEVEEIYAYAFSRGEKYLKKELKFIHAADKYILVNDLIANILHLSKCKTIISYGPYLSDLDDQAVSPFNDGKIHLVYAGSFDKRKMGAQSAVQVAPFLPSNYAIHILGFGDSSTTQELICEIELINQKSKCSVYFEGEKRGIDYVNFMKKCHIGLCTQRLECDYTTYAFPSKVLAYFSYGLNVVSAPLVALQNSSINSYLSYYAEDDTKSLAEAIMNAKLYRKDELTSVIYHLNEKFVKSIRALIEL